MPIPPDTRAPGDTGHIADHNQISDELTTLAAAVALIPIASGGTGQTTRQAALDAITGTQTSGTVLRSDGTHATLSTIQAADVPTLNQSTTGTAAAANALKSATTTVSVSSATAPSSGQVLTATGGTAATWQTPSGGGGGITAVQTTSAGSGTVTLNAASYAAVVLTLTGGSVTLALSGASAGNEAAVVLYTIQSGGPWTVTWPTVTWAGGSAPSVPSSGVGIFTFTSPDNGTTWYGAQVTAAPALPLSVSNGGTGLASAGVAGTFLSSTGLTSAGAYTGLIPPAIPQTLSTVTATLGQLNPIDATSNNVTVTLPAGAFSGQIAAVKMIATASSHTVTVQPTAPDIIGRATGFTSGSYSTSATLNLTGQGQLFAYQAPAPSACTVAAGGSANITIATTTAPFAAGQLVYFTAGTMPSGAISANTPYYVVNPSGPTSGTFTFQVASTAGGTGIIPTSTGTAVIVATCGNWTTVADDLPLSQLDARYEAAGSAGMAKLAATSLGGYAKVNGTGTILTWTAPNDGVMHRVMLMAVERITTTEVGGTVTVTSGFPDGTTGTAKTLFTAAQAAGYEYSANASCPTMFLLGPNTTITVAQQSALTSGASTVWVELWGS